MTPAHFVEVIISFRPRLEKLFGSQYIDDLETEQRDLRIAYQRERVLRSMLDGMDDSIGFCEGWGPTKTPIRQALHLCRWHCLCLSWLYKSGKWILRHWVGEIRVSDFPHGFIARRHHAYEAAQGDSGIK
jgi:hypothetical protein